MTFSVAACRRISGSLFLTANLSLFFTNLVTPNPWQIASALLFMTCSVSLILSARNHRWLFWAGFAVIVAYGMAAFTGDGNGTTLQILGGVTGFIGGILVFRSAFQEETGKQYSLPRPLDLLDRYPLAAAGVIEGACCLLILSGSLLSADYRLAFASAIWSVAHGFMIAGDKPLRARLSAQQSP